MGDIADYTLETIFGGNDPECLDDGFNMFDEEQGNALMAPITIPSCRYCGKSPLAWQQTERGWRLFTMDGQLHTCPQYKRQ